MIVQLAENFRAVFYAPFYLAFNAEFSHEEGLDLRFVPAAAPGDAVRLQLAGHLDVSWSGPMRVIKDREDRPDARGHALVAFHEVVGADPFFLLARPGHGPFDLGLLADASVALVGETPTPRLCLQQDLRDAGCAHTGAGWVTDLSMADAYEAFRQGRFTYIQLCEPYVSMAEMAGIGEVVYAASRRGPTAYTSLIATRDVLQGKRREMEAVSNTIQRARTWMESASAERIAQELAAYFPEMDAAVLQSSIRRYTAAGIWPRDPRVSKEGFARLALSVRSGGLVHSIPDYEDCIAQFEPLPVGHG